MADSDVTSDSRYQAYVEAVRSKNRVKLQEAIRKIREVYDSGTPFFTKDAIRDIMQQLEKVESGQLNEVSVMGLDGIVVQLPANIGEFKRDIEIPGVETVHPETRIRYCAVDHLTMMGEPASFDLRSAYLPLGIRTVHYRDVTTKPPTPQPPHLALEEARGSFQQTRIAWEASKQCEELKLLLGSADIPPVRKIVAFACSTMRWGDKVRHRSIVQHALILTIRDCLTKHIQSDNLGIVECYVQDPTYTSTDRQVLEDYGITVLDDPRGFLEIDEETIVLSHAPDIPVRQITADLTRPAMMIWDKVKERPNPLPPPECHREIGRVVLWTDPTSPRLENMVRQYVQLDFPKDLDNFCQDTTIYIRKLARVSEDGAGLPHQAQETSSTEQVQDSEGRLESGAERDDGVVRKLCV